MILVQVALRGLAWLAMSCCRIIATSGEQNETSPGVFDDLGPLCDVHCC